MYKNFDTKRPNPLMMHYLDACTGSAGHHRNLMTQRAPAWSAVGDLVRGVIRTAKRVRRWVW